MKEQVMLKLAIMEDNAELCRLMTHYLSSLNSYEIVGSASDGENGLRLIRAHQADIAIIDLIMPGKDGFYVLEELSKQADAKPVCIVLSGINLDHIVKQAFDYGADYFIVKPFDMELLARRIREIWVQKNKSAGRAVDIKRPSPPALNSKESFVIEILHNLPVPQTLQGYAYIKTAILLTIDDAYLLEGVTKFLYPAVAKLHKANSPQVERAIRHAISVAWRKGGSENYANLMGYGNPTAPKPTNTALIRAIVELYHHIYNSNPT